MLASVPDVDQSDIRSRHLTDDEEFPGFVLREALLTAVENQRVALWERGEIASRYLHDNPQKVRELDLSDYFLDPELRRLVRDHIAHDPYYRLGANVRLFYSPLPLYSLGWFGYFQDRDFIALSGREVMGTVRREIEVLLGRPDSDALTPYINYLIELLRTIELETLVQSYI
jgi:hypothetical protein